MGGGRGEEVEEDGGSRSVNFDVIIIILNIQLAFLAGCLYNEYTEKMAVGALEYATNELIAT